MISSKDQDPLFAEATSLLGGEILRNFAVTLDQRSRLVRFERTSQKPIQMRGYNKPIFSPLD
jgi:hypothetical protein